MLQTEFGIWTEIQIVPVKTTSKKLITNSHKPILLGFFFNKTKIFFKNLITKYFNKI